MAELISTRCQQGRLIITENVVKVQLGGIREQSLNRSSLTGVDSKMVVPSIFGLGGGTNLVFHGQGSELRAGMVKPKVAKKLKQLLGF